MTCVVTSSHFICFKTLKSSNNCCFSSICHKLGFVYTWVCQGETFKDSLQVRSVRRQTAEAYRDRRQVLVPLLWEQAKKGMIMCIFFITVYSYDHQQDLLEQFEELPLFVARAVLNSYILNSNLCNKIYIRAQITFQLLS